MKRHFRRVALAAVAAAWLPACPAAAQALVQEVSPAPVPGWTFTPGAVVGFVYDSNVAIAAAPASTHATEASTLLMLEPTGRLAFLGRHTSLSTDYTGQLRRYTSVPELDDYAQHAHFSLQQQLRQSTWFVQNSYADVPTTDEVELNGAPFQRTGTRTDSFGAGFDATLSPLSKLSVRYDLTWARFDRTAPSLTGGLINGVSSAFDRAVSGRLSVGAEGQLRFAAMNDAASVLRFQHVGGTLHYALAPHTQVAGALGMAFLQDPSRAISRSGPYTRASIDQVTPAGVYGAAYERSFVPSFGFGGSTNSQEVRGWVDLPPIGRRVFVHSSLAWRRSNPLERQDVARDTTYLRASVGYAIARTVRVDGFYVYTRQAALERRLAGGTVNRSRAGIELTFFNPMRIQ
ncbi:MAG TPA: hypothetical protein VFX12_04465 [Vicinamibacterales bacterium]|nr:hypothetical protein [Vicinamibacterales bacterium]